MKADGAAPAAENRAMLWRLWAVALGMFAFGFALVPFYEQICQALGVNNLAAAEAALPANSQVDLSRSVTVELDGNVHGLPWRFQPLQRSVTVHPGELAHVEFEVANVRGAPVTGQAVPSYGPQVAGQYFGKLECFCFAQQTLGANEVRRMPLVFAVDPKLPRDIGTITLSYTFFEVAGLGGRK